MSTPAIELTPVLATAPGDAVRYELPGGIALEFQDAEGSLLIMSAFEKLGLTLPELALAAGIHATTSIAWIEVAKGVYRNDDGCWPELACAPGSFLEHHAVEGAPMLYVSSEQSSILTGSESREGLKQIRLAMREGLALCAMAWRRDQRCWVPSDASLRIGIAGAHAGSSTTYVYLDEVPEHYAYDGNRRIEFTTAARSATGSSSKPLQATIRRLGRGAGVLGARFTPARAGHETVVSVSVRSPPIAAYDNGLSPEMAGPVLKGFERISRGDAFTSLGPGRLDIDWAQEHPIDSSASGFRQLAERLVPLLTLPADAIDDDVTTAWRVQHESVQFATLFDWLEECISTHPERGARFGVGASDPAIGALESDLRLSLPSAFRTMVRRHDGGRFAEQAEGESTPHSAKRPVDVRRSSCELLSLDQIRRHFADLVAARDAGEEPSAPWPRLPIARTTEGSELLSLDLSDGPLGVRVGHARQVSGSSTWAELYATYLEFVEDFMYQGGEVLVREKSAAPPAVVAAASPASGPSLQALARDIRAWSDDTRESGGEIAPADRHLLWILWADLFRYEVTQGGFAQLVFNADSGGMGNIGKMLDVTRATTASRYFKQAVELCDASPQALDSFRGADFSGQSPLKDALHRVSLAYFREGIDFEQEVAPYVRTASAKVEAMALRDVRRPLLASRESFRAFAPEPRADYWALAERGDNARVYELLAQQSLSLRNVKSAALTSTRELAPCTLLFVTAWDTYSATALGRLKKTLDAGVEPDGPTCIVFIGTNRETVLESAADAWYLSRAHVIDENHEPRIGELIGRIPFRVGYSAAGRVTQVWEGLGVTGVDG